MPELGRDPDDPHLASLRNQVGEALWRDMDPLVRIRFHEQGNRIMEQQGDIAKLQGIIAGLTARVPADAALLPELQVRVKHLENGHVAIGQSVDKVDRKVDAMRQDIGEKLDGLSGSHNALALKFATAAGAAAFLLKYLPTPG